MKKLLALAMLASLSIPAAGQSGDPYLPFQPVVAAAVSDGQLDGSVKFFLRGQTPANGVKEIFPEAVYDKPAGTQVINISINRACATALRRVLASFEGYAKQFGANAVIDIVSFYDQKHYEDANNFWCHQENTGTYVVKLRGKPAIIK
ncbi:MAG: hypothetical protein LBR05_09530 [Azoarcus sp.]|jgi:hypothetical protein|nr:hypothetical protein [Azoarcus sp.]